MIWILPNPDEEKAAPDMDLSGILDFAHCNLMVPTLPDFSSVSILSEGGLITPDNMTPVTVLIFGGKLKARSDVVGLKQRVCTRSAFCHSIFIEATADRAITDIDVCSLHSAL